MSLFTKSPKDGAPKPDPVGPKAPVAASRPTVQRGPAAPNQNQSGAGNGPPAAPKHAAPAVVPTRIVDASPTGRARPPMPAIAIGPPAPPEIPVAAPAPAADRVAAAPAAVAPPSAFSPVPIAAIPLAPAPAAAQPVVALAAPMAHAPPPAPEPSSAARIEPLAAASVRPKAPGLTDTDGSHVSIADTFERLLSLEELDEGFAKIQGVPDPKGGHSAALTDLAEVRALFSQLAVNHVRQVRDFMIDLRWRDATLDWIGICEPALRSLRRAADKLELHELCAALDRFSAALAVAQASGGQAIDGERRDGLIARYDELSALMPQAFALDLDQTQREAVILQSLLLQVPDVKKVTLDKLYAAGLTTIETLFLATASDIAATTGIGEGLAGRIVERFRAYRAQVKSAVPDATRARERERVAELTAKLRQEHDEYERAAQSWTREADEKRKAVRRARSQTLLDLQVVLARLGEVERLKELERLPFERKVVHLESFLEEAREKYVAQP